MGSSYPSPPHSPDITKESLDPATMTAPSTADFEPLKGYTGRQSPSPNLGRRTSTTRGSSTTSGRAKSTSSASGRSGRSPGPTSGHDPVQQARMRESARLAPPTDPSMFETEEEWRNYHAAEKADSWVTHAPLVMVALPPLGAIVHGRAENWADGLMLILICFYLYQLIKAPWELYYVSRTRYILQESVIQGDDDPIKMARRRQASRVLRTAELGSLALIVSAPVIGAYLLHWASKFLLSDPERYINRFTISLFCLATSVKPLVHLIKLLESSELQFRTLELSQIEYSLFSPLSASLFYQEAVWYPSTEVHLLRRRVVSLEKEISSLTHAFATKDEVRDLRDGVDIPLGQLSKAVRRTDRAEADLRLTSEQRFAIMDSRLERSAREAADNAERIEQLRKDNEEAAHPINAILKVFSHIAMGQGNGDDRRPAVKWFEKGPLWFVFFPLNVSTLAIEWAASASRFEELDSDGREEKRISGATA